MSKEIHGYNQRRDSNGNERERRVSKKRNNESRGENRSNVHAKMSKDHKEEMKKYRMKGKGKKKNPQDNGYSEIKRSKKESSKRN